MAEQKSVNLVSFLHRIEDDKIYSIDKYEKFQRARKMVLMVHGDKVDYDIGALHVNDEDLVSVNIGETKDNGLECALRQHITIAGMPYMFRIITDEEIVREVVSKFGYSLEKRDGENISRWYTVHKR